MTSLQSYGGLRSIKANDSDKAGKPRGKVVKPILKKLSPSERSSLDLDRGWDEQDEPYRSSAWDGGPTSFYASGVTNRSGSAKDVGFAYADVAVGGGRRYHHSRSISGNSHISIATSGSGSGVGPRTGTTFVHPFQQIPRTATPPLSMSYANSQASFADRDYSPTITEAQDDDDYELDPPSSHNSLHNGNSSGGILSSSQHQQQQQQQQQPSNAAVYSHSQPSLISSAAHPRRPSLASQRTSSYSDSAKSHNALRINTGMRSTSTTPAQSSRLAHVSSQAELNLQLEQESPGSINAPPSTHRGVASPTSPVASMSPFSRSSFEAVGFPRLRAKSDLDTATRAEHLREARRKVLAKEQAKEERQAQKEIRQRERADNKRAQEAERRAAAIRKEREAARRQDEISALAEAMPPKSKHARKISGTSSGRPSTSHMRHPVESEKPASGNHDTVETSSPPFVSQAGGGRNVSFQSSRRTNTAKKKTHGAWTAFILWLRTRLLRMGSG
ncbi:hypothetical protein JX266_013133 [Neoarthrinium moseri]|nr:hypothetical protein JX266_013133 [Neoarthrinium moseri]